MTPNAFTSRSGWGAVLLNSGDWDAGFQIVGGNEEEEVEGFSVLLDTSLVGTYSSLFGSDPLTTLFFNSEGSAIDEFSDEFSGYDAEFFFAGNSQSEFVALGSGGTIIDGSLVAIPEPSSAILFSLGMLSMALRGRRRRIR